MLVNFQLEKLNRQMVKDVRKVSNEVMELFLSYDRPGNVRELNNLLERSMILFQDEILKSEHLGNFVSKVLESRQELSFSSDAPLEKIRMHAEANAIQKALELTGGNRSKTASILKISRTALYDKLKKYNLL